MRSASSHVCVFVAYAVLYVSNQFSPAGQINNVLSSEFCKRSGYTEELSCKFCKELNLFGLNALRESCLACCDVGHIASPSKVHCSIEAFVDKITESPNIQFITKSGHPPTAILLNEEDGEAQESYAIETWDTDTIEDFFRERLL
ncbi:unnamed protein product [Hydatigera taeniaeformis]|uniref:Selenoprotein F n=1 Tax=Hydatigena taeniaeformis TaxID=6205 RepID=A0A0R3WHJ3_HYDTA|nr:unnamed protein product [Hydatigera taeniaeformis]